jgi:hypothetical protein
MNTSIPPFEKDLVDLITTELPNDFPPARLSIGGEPPVGGKFAEEHTSIRFIDDVPQDYDAVGAVHGFTCQIKHRWDRAKDPEGIDAEARMRRLYEALRMYGAWTGVSGATYMDILCRTFPRMVEEHYVFMDVTIDSDVEPA